jgi:hypothetical protein
MKTAKNLVKLGNMSVPEKINNAHVIEVAVKFMENVSEDMFHSCLSPIRKLV